MNNSRIDELESIIQRDYKNMRGLVIRHHGSCVYEKYYQNYRADDVVHVYSITKSIISLLIGIAIDKGFIKSIHQPVLDFFTDYEARDEDDVIHKVTLEDLMTMRAPFQFDEEPYEAYFSSDDWVKTALDLLGGKKMSGEFRYTPLIGPDILSGILMRSSGKRVLDFANEYVFEPLHIHVPSNIVFHNVEEQMAFYMTENISGWVADPKGVNTAGWGLNLSVKDMANIGQLYLNQGVWEGQQIVSAQWIQESTKEHIRWKEMNLPYGYLWWAGIDHGFAAMGDGGNVIYVNPDHDLVIAIGSLMDEQAKDVLDLIHDTILPVIIQE